MERRIREVVALRAKGERGNARAPGWNIAIAGAVLALVTGIAAAQTVVPPVPVLGPFPVACSNVEQDLARLAPGETADLYWRGGSGGGNERYVTTLLAAPANALVTTFAAPDDSALYDRWSGKPLTYAFLACYPTTAANARADYVLPGNTVVPRMQRGADAPILPATPGRLPVLAFSHGYGGSPLSGSYLDALLAYASWGYVVVAPFHGDLRYSALGPDTATASLALYIPVWSEFVPMQATRPLSVSAGLDLLLAHPQWRDRLDPARIAAFGISQGGETVMLLGGAELTYQFLTFRSKRVTLDARVRAGVGYVPYFGISGIPAFGNNQHGVDAVTLPFLALSGDADAIAPAGVTRDAIDRLPGTRGQVLLAGQGHDLTPASAGDITTWGLTFLWAFVGDDPSARTRLLAMQSVAGGLDDRKATYADPLFLPTAPAVVDVVEFRNARLDHYFVTAFPDEAAMLDQGVLVPGWTRTGFGFKAWQSGTGPGNEACRFFGTPGRGPDSHFYTVAAYECAKVRANPDWTFEALAFRAVEPLAAGCAADQATVTRLYNDGAGGQANDRFLNDAAEIGRMVARGWRVEGAVFCVPR